MINFKMTFEAKGNKCIFCNAPIPAIKTNNIAKAFDVEALTICPKCRRTKKGGAYHLPKSSLKGLKGRG